MIRRAGLRHVRAPTSPLAPADATILGPQLSLWLRSDRGVTLASGKVSQWDDQSGNGANFVQGTAARQPAYAASDANFSGHPSISPTATDANLRATAATITIQHALIVANQPLGLFAGIDLRGLLIASGTQLAGLTGTTNWRVNGVSLGVRYRDGSVTEQAIDVPGRAHIYECAWLAPTTSAGGWFLGGDSGDPSREWGGGIVEVIASNVRIPDRQAAQLRLGLKQRYGTP